MAKNIDTYTGPICECCLMSYYNGEGCDCRNLGPGLGDHALLPWHFEDISLDHDADSQHFGNTCIGCDDRALAGDRYDGSITVH